MDEAMGVDRSAPQRYILAPLPVNKEGYKGLMVLRVKPTPTRFATHSLYTPVGSTPMHSIPNVCRPWALLLSYLISFKMSLTF